MGEGDLRQHTNEAPGPGKPKVTNNNFAGINQVCEKPINMFFKNENFGH